MTNSTFNPTCVHDGAVNIYVFGKWPEGEADHLPPCSFDVMNVWIIISTSLCAFKV